MAGNRKLPFGYQMEMGKIVVHPEEALTVCPDAFDDDLEKLIR